MPIYALRCPDCQGTREALLGYDEQGLCPLCTQAERRVPQPFGSVCRSTETLDKATVDRALADKRYIEARAGDVRSGALKVTLDKTLPGELQPKV